MNWESIEGKWRQVRGTIREKWGKLTDDDLDVIAGKRDQLIGKIEERYGYAKEKAERAVEDWLHTFESKRDPSFESGSNAR